MKLENLDKKIKKGKKPLTVFDVDLAIAFEITRSFAVMRKHITGSSCLKNGFCLKKQSSERIASRSSLKSIPLEKLSYSDGKVM